MRDHLAKIFFSFSLSLWCILEVSCNLYRKKSLENSSPAAAPFLTRITRLPTNVFHCEVSEVQFLPALVASNDRRTTDSIWVYPPEV